MENNNSANTPNTASVKRGRRIKYDTEEKKQARRQEKLTYYKEYYKNNKERIDKMNTENWKKKLKEMREIVNNKEIIELYNKIKNAEKNETSN